MSGASSVSSSCLSMSCAPQDAAFPVRGFTSVIYECLMNGARQGKYLFVQSETRFRIFQFTACDNDV